MIRQLERPTHIRGDPEHVAVLGLTVLVCYTDNTMLTYHRDSPTPGQVLKTPQGVEAVTRITTDSHSSSSLISAGRSVFVLDDKRIWHLIHTAVLKIHESVMAQSQLWLTYFGKDIVVLTSQ